MMHRVPVLELRARLSLRESIFLRAFRIGKVNFYRTVICFVVNSFNIELPTD